EFVCLSITVVEFLFTTFTGLFHKKCDRLKARVVIYAYNHHVRLLSPEPVVVKQPQFTRVEEPTLLCNHLPYHYSLRLMLEFDLPSSTLHPGVLPCSVQSVSKNL